MSGQLVGEVLDAREAGQLDGLSHAALLALVTIAEKCHHTTRQGAVRTTRIEAATGKSRRTAVRMIRTLKDRELIRVVKHGYKSHGVGHANVYELAVLAPPKMTHAPEDACATHDVASDGDMLAPNPDMLAPNPDMLAPPMDGHHDGLYDGLNDGTTPPYPPTREQPPAPPVTRKRRNAAPKRRTQIRDDYMPPQTVIAAIRAEFPNATNDDLNYQHRKFLDHWRKTGKPMADWDATWRNWIRTANERGELCRRNGQPTRSTVDQKVDGWRNAVIPTTNPPPPQRGELE